MDAPPGFLSGLRDADKLEAVTISVGFDDLLDVTLPLNLLQLDALYVVTSSKDARTIQVCKKHGAIPVVTDVLGDEFAKGAGINLGFLRARYRGWRVCLDADIVLPSHFRRALVNYESLDHQVLYGADRVNLIGQESWARVTKSQWGEMETIYTGLPIGPRLMSSAYGYVPIGYFQLWHSDCHKPYPSTLGGAGLDDVTFALQWPQSHRRLLPSFVVYHLCVSPPTLGENWDGIRRHPRTDVGPED